MLFVLFLVALQAAAPARPIAVFVVPVVGNAEGFVDAELKRRQDSATDLIRSLKGPVGVTTNRDDADLVVEVLSSQWETTGETNTRTTVMPPLAGGGLSSSTSEDKEPTLTVKLTAGTYTTEIKGRGKIAWRQAADDAAQRIHRWVRENRTQLLARRAK